MRVGPSYPQRLAVAALGTRCERADAAFCTKPFYNIFAANLRPDKGKYEITVCEANVKFYGTEI